MKNDIRQVREAIEEELLRAKLCPEENSLELSPCGRYLLSVHAYGPEDQPGWITVLVARVVDAPSGAEVVTVKCNDSRCFHGWVSRDGHDYLLLSEDLEGHTVIDLTGRRVHGFSSPEERFIWVNCHPSPDRTKLAVYGCYWACPYGVTVYDFSVPSEVPLRILAQYQSEGHTDFGGWVSETSLSVTDASGVRRVCDLPP